MTSESALPIGWILAMSLALPAQAATGMTEEGYFDALPVVLTVSRLEQPISDTPGAVTVIDRDTIRRAAARDVTDLLRLVPGYLVSGWNGANPSVSYHAPFDDFGTRNLVLIDGRSVYSPFYLGDTHHGLMTVLLEDIERIEVLRGSNSAAYGANAMFGVINIVTRHSADTLGQQATFTAGDGGVQDVQARVGWGDPLAATYRLSAGQRKDDGYPGLNDSRDLRQMHFRLDWRQSAQQEFLLESGVTELRAGEGFATDIGNPLRNTTWRDFYIKGQWTGQLSDTEQVKLAVDFDEEHNADSSPYGNTGVVLDFGGRGRRYNIELQHHFSLADNLRLVWGSGLKQDQARSYALFNVPGNVRLNEARLFGNLEWRLSPRWLINAGAFIGKNNWTGTYKAPRLMANFHLTPDHTLRAGVTRSVRAPSMFELAGNVRYYVGSALVGNTTLATGNVEPENLSSKEIGYFGHFRDWRMTLDVRAYHEKMTDMVWTALYPRPYPIPAGSPFWGTGNRVRDYVNLPGVTAKGVEYQWRWSPVDGTDFWLNQNWESFNWTDNSRYLHIPPDLATTLAWFQQLPAQMQLTVQWQALGSMPWRSQTNVVPATHRLDVRLAYPFRIGSTRAEMAVTVQSLNGGQPEFQTGGAYASERRAFVSLRLED